MFILLMIISQCFSYQIKLCNVVSLIDAPCNEKCFQTTTPNSDLLSLKYSCLNNFSDFIDCLISLGKSIENSLFLAHPCLNSNDLISLQGFSSILQEQSYCLSYFVMKILIEEWKILEQNHEYLGYSIRENYIDDCKVSTYRFAALIAEKIFENIINSDTKDIVKILLDEFCDFYEEAKDNDYDKNNEKNIFGKLISFFYQIFDTAFFKDQTDMNDNKNAIEMLTLILYKILDASGNFIYLVVNRINYNVPLKNLKGILPDDLMKTLNKYLEQSKKIINTDEYKCSKLLNCLIDLVFSTFLPKIINKIAIFTGFIECKSNYYYDK